MSTKSRSGTTNPDAARWDVHASKVRGTSQQGKMSLCWGTVKMDYKRGPTSLSKIWGQSAASTPPIFVQLGRTKVGWGLSVARVAIPQNHQAEVLGAENTAMDRNLIMQRCHDQLEALLIFQWKRHSLPITGLSFTFLSKGQ